MEIFGNLERLAASLYPLRIPIAIGTTALFALALFGAYRLGLGRLIWRHKLASGVIGATALVVLAPAAYYLGSPVWTRTSLIEPASGTSGGAPSDLSPQNAILRGAFTGADDFHFGRGRALITEAAPAQYTLRFEDFSVQNGPDLYVYLSTNPAGFAPDAINLGRLKASDGAFNYDIPAGTDISRVRSVVVWCRQFSVLFATAPVT